MAASVSPVETNGCHSSIKSIRTTVDLLNTGQHCCCCYYDNYYYFHVLFQQTS